ncbi:tetratricopeptide repeat protein [bacterium]|nr:tetratricopeptide repeat protein [bacterium]
MLRKHKKLTKKELKQDPLVIFTAQFLDYIQGEWMKIGGTILAVLLIIFVSMFIVKGKHASENKAYDAALIALQTNAPEAPDLLKTVVEKHGGSQSAAMALIQLGNMYFQKKDYDQAEKYFTRYIDKFSGDVLTDFNAYNGLGSVLEEKNEPAKAAAIYEKFISKHANSPFTSMMCINTAKAFWLAGNKEQAKTYFLKVVDNPYDSNEKQEAQYYLETLQIQ